MKNKNKKFVNSDSTGFFRFDKCHMAFIKTNKIKAEISIDPKNKSLICTWKGCAKSWVPDETCKE